MATKETRETKKISYFINKDGKDDSDMVVIINGRKTKIKRGEAVELDPAVVEVIQNSQKQTGRAYAYSTAMENKKFADM